MPKRKVKSPWRDKIWEQMGLQITKEIKRKVGNSYFTVQRDLIKDGDVPSVAHCKPSVRMQYIAAILSELQHKRKIKRLGKAYYFPKKKECDEKSTSN